MLNANVQKLSENPCTLSLEPLNKHCRTSLRSSWPPAGHDLFALHFPPCLTEIYANWIVTQSLMESHLLGSTEENSKRKQKIVVDYSLDTAMCWVISNSGLDDLHLVLSEPRTMRKILRSWIAPIKIFHHKKLNLHSSSFPPTPLWSR